MDQTEQEEAAASAPVDPQPAALRTHLSGPPAPCTPPVVQPDLSQEFLPPSSSPLFTQPPRRQVQPQQPAASQVQPQTPSDALLAMPTFSGAPQTPDVGRASTVAPLTPAPAQSSLGNPWAATRERMSSATLQVEGACPTSAGLSETSTLPVQRSMGVQSVGAGSVISAQACPMTGVGGSYPYYQPPAKAWRQVRDRRTTAIRTRFERTDYPSPSCRFKAEIQQW